jgi:serine protease inhibitor
MPWFLRLNSWLSFPASVSVSAKRRLLAGCLSLAVILAAAAEIVSAWPQTPRPFDASPEVESVVAANTAFAVDLYQRLKLNHENLFFSPYSISTALAMTYAGARGQTADEMAKALHLDSAQGGVQAAFGELTKRLNEVQRRNITLLATNSLWCQKEHPFTSAFLKVIRKDYGASGRTVDFIRDSEAARNEINSWVAAKTAGKIKDLIAPEQLRPLTRLVLCNAIYFKGKWQTQFRTSDTRPRPFYLSPNEMVTVPMMSLHAHFKLTYAGHGSIGLLELPYVGNDLSMVILLPVAEPPWQGPNQPRISELSDLEAKLTPQNLSSWLDQLDGVDASDADIAIPRFTTTQTFDLSEQLKSLGMSSAFGDSADFSGMDGMRDLYISDVVHKAYVEVDEHGTEAAAATSVQMVASAIVEPFVVDHPFIFLIRDNASGAILFLGRIVDPTK